MKLYAVIDRDFSDDRTGYFYEGLGEVRRLFLDRSAAEQAVRAQTVRAYRDDAALLAALLEDIEGATAADLDDESLWQLCRQQERERAEVHEVELPAVTRLHGRERGAALAAVADVVAPFNPDAAVALLVRGGR